MDNQNLSTNDRIQALVNSEQIFLFMKGDRGAPQCGFSAGVIEMLNITGVDYKTFDILSDMDIRNGVKDYSNWPTFPQLYYKGKLIGGGDIVKELFEDGELKAVLSA